MPSKKKKAAASPSDGTPPSSPGGGSGGGGGAPPSSPATAATADGLPVALVDEAVVAATSAPAGCALLHWDTLKRLGVCLGDAVVLTASVAGVSEPAAAGQPLAAVALTAWASARVPNNGRAVVVPTEVRAALQQQQQPPPQQQQSSTPQSPAVPITLRARPGGGGGSGGGSGAPSAAAGSGALAEATTLELCAVDEAQDEELAGGGFFAAAGEGQGGGGGGGGIGGGGGLGGGGKMALVASQMIGCPVVDGGLVALRLHGRPLVLRAVRCVGEGGGDGTATSGEGGGGGGSDAAAAAAAAATSGAAAARVLRVSTRTRIVLSRLREAARRPALPPPQHASHEPATGAGAGTGTAAAAAAPPPPSSAPSSEVAGMADLVSRVREAIELPLLHRRLFDAHGVPPPTGVLLHGPPGTGKTLLARSICAAIGAHVVEVGAAQLLSDAFGGAEAQLSAAFAAARARAPSVLFIDEIDGIAAARDGLGGGGGAGGAGGGGGGGAAARLLALLLTEMDGAIARPEAVLVLGATNRPEALDPALRRPGRFDSEIEVGVPSEDGRAAVLDGLFRRTPHKLKPAQRREAAACTAGFVGADLAALHRHAALRAIARHALAQRSRRGDHDGDGGDGDGDGDGEGKAAGESGETVVGGGAGGGAGAAIRWGDVRAALKTVKPSALREVELRVPDVSWGDIGGQEDLKAALREAVEWPLSHPDAFARMGIRPPRGVLLYGPPGCSKTLAAKALAAESRTNFLAVKGPELFSKWVGESERAVASLFRRARAAAPSIIFFDEIDALAARRGAGEGGAGGVGARVLSQLLSEMDGVSPLTSVLVVAATNRPDLVDPALLRPGRFDSLLHVGLPDEVGRRQVLGIHTKRMPLGASVDLDQLARDTDGYSGAELAALTREAALAALEEAAPTGGGGGGGSGGGSAATGSPLGAAAGLTVEVRHIEGARRVVTPRTTKETLAFFEAYERRVRAGGSNAREDQAPPLGK